jgi:hypothetical protein
MPFRKKLSPRAEAIIANLEREFEGFTEDDWRIRDQVVKEVSLLLYEAEDTQDPRKREALIQRAVSLSQTDIETMKRLI